MNHEYIREQIKGFPASELIFQWLKAGFVDNQVFHVTPEGTPQGGIISPLLANIALHGMEEVLGIQYHRVLHGIRNGKQVYGWENHTTYMTARYADDFVILCEKKENAENIYKLLEDYLKQRGLELQPEKTKITNIWDSILEDIQRKVVLNYSVNRPKKV